MRNDDDQPSWRQARTHTHHDGVHSSSTHRRRPRFHDGNVPHVVVKILAREPQSPRLLCNRNTRARVDGASITPCVTTAGTYHGKQLLLWHVVRERDFKLAHEVARGRFTVQVLHRRHTRVSTCRRSTGSTITTAPRSARHSPAVRRVCGTSGGREPAPPSASARRPPAPPAASSRWGPSQTLTSGRRR